MRVISAYEKCTLIHSKFETLQYEGVKNNNFNIDIRR